MLDNRIRAIKKAFMALIITIAATWQVMTTQMKRISDFKLHQDVTIAYLIVNKMGNSKGYNFVHEDENIYHNVDSDLKQNHPYTKILDYVFNGNYYPREFEFFAPADLTKISVIFTESKGNRVLGTYNYDSPLKQSGSLEFRKLQNNDDTYWDAEIDVRSIKPKDWAGELQRKSSKFDVFEQDPEKAIFKTRVKWKTNKSSIPIIGINVNAKKALPILFILALIATILITNNVHHVLEFKIIDRKEPWIIIDNNKYIKVKNYFRSIAQMIAEYSTQVIYFSVIILGAPLIGLSYLYLLNNYNFPIWLMYLILFAITVSLLSGMMAVSAMIKLRKKLLKN